MDFMEISVCTTAEGIDHVTGALMQTGITGFVIEDSADFKEFLEHTGPHWDYVDESLAPLATAETKVKFYLPEMPESAEALFLAKEAVSRLASLDTEKKFGRLVIESTSVREEDWESNWKKYFKPFPVGERLFVRPSWESADGAGNRQVLTIDPGSSFGTGQHYTTRMCLEAAEETVHPGDSVLDLGCGSGILSVAALLLGADTAEGIDIDPYASKTAFENAAKNNIYPPRFTARTGDAVTDDALAEWLSAKKFDVVFANIVADVIIGLAPRFRGFMKDDARLIVSGIISERFAEVSEILLSNGLEIKKTFESGGWNAAILEIK